MLRNYFTPILGLSLIFILAGCSHKPSAACNRTYTEIQQQYQQLRDMPPGNEDFYTLTEQIEGRLFKSFEQCPTDARHPALMSEVQITAGQPSLALLYAQKALATDPDIWQSQYAMANTLSLVQNYKEAVVHAELASKLAPQRPGLQLGLCRAYAQAGKHAQAIHTCTAILDSTHTELHATAYYLRSLALRGEGDSVKADQDLQQAQALGYKIN